MIIKLPRAHLHSATCDFCLTPQSEASLTVFRCIPFSVALDNGDVYTDDGEWEACATCVPLVTAGDLRALVWLALRNGREQAVEIATNFRVQGVGLVSADPDTAHGQVRTMLEAFFANRIVGA